MRSKPRLAAAALALLLGVLVAVYATSRSSDGGAQASSTSEIRKAGSCRVTTHPSRTLYGTFGKKSTIYVAAVDDGPIPKGTTRGHVMPDGRIYAKILWRRKAHVDGKLKLKAKRLDGPSGGFEAVVGQDDPRFNPSGLTFPSAGCWRITAQAGNVRVKNVVRVVKQKSQ